jgi:hypothetical protein
MSGSAKHLYWAKQGRNRNLFTIAAGVHTTFYFGVVRWEEEVSLLHGLNHQLKAFGSALGSIIDLSNNQATEHFHHGGHIP